jgi:hypothetical protein
VVVVWKDEKRTAKIRGVKGKQAVIQLDGDPHERKVPAYTVLPYEQPPAPPIPVEAM